MKILLTLLLLLVNVKSYDFVEYDNDFFHLPGHLLMCYNNPTSIFCENFESAGKIRPTRDYAINVANDLNLNYLDTLDWYYNNNIHDELIGDCEDVAMTIINHMISDGIDKKFLHLVYLITFNGDSAHVFVAVDTIDSGIIHIDYPGSGYPIEQINYHMRMDNSGTFNWIKGNMIAEPIEYKIMLVPIIVNGIVIILNYDEPVDYN